MNPAVEKHPATEPHAFDGKSKGRERTMTETAGLGAALGLELELQSSEAPVGTLSLDLLARDTEQNEQPTER